MKKTDSLSQLELLLSEKEAEEFYKKGPEAVIFKLLELSKEIKELREKLSTSSSTTPSSQITVYKKPPASKSRKKPGQKKGHKGTRREAPPNIDRHETHALESCPHCGNQDMKVTQKRKLITEDIHNVTI